MIETKKPDRLFLRLLCSLTVIGLCVCAVTAKTRWSALHLVPDADLLRGGEYQVGADVFLARSDAEEFLTPQSYLLDLGIIEYVNIQAGYSGGFTMGLKARLLGETHRFMPSLAVGAHNLFTHKESNYFDFTGEETPENELFVALSKSIETIKTRLHAGVQSVPDIETERVNPFFALEKYFGFGLYASLEGYRRFEQFPVSLFVTWRTLKNRLEISGGAVDMQSLFFDANNKFAVSLQPEANNTFARPGIWLGIRFHGTAGFGKRDGFLSLEDRLSRQQLLIDSLYRKVDSLEAASNTVRSAVEELDNSVTALTDSGFGDNQLEGILLDKMVSLKSLYAAAPFEPDRVREVLDEIVGYREQAVPVLQEFVLDTRQDRYVRMYSITALGEIGNRAASDVLLDLIGQTADPDLKVEILIALGKMKETRAMFVMEQLANDPNDAVALTAQEVLSRLSRQTGASISRDVQFRSIEERGGEEDLTARKVADDTSRREPEPLPKEKVVQERSSGGLESVLQDSSEESTVSGKTINTSEQEKKTAQSQSDDSTDVDFGEVLEAAE